MYKHLTLLWMLIILGLSITPGNYLPPLQFDLIAPDALAHILFYLVLHVLASLWQRPATFVGETTFVLALGAVCYGFFIELVQGHFIPGRYFDYADVLSNGLGTSMGIGMYPLLERWMPKK